MERSDEKIATHGRGKSCQWSILTGWMGALKSAAGKGPFKVEGRENSLLSRPLTAFIKTNQGSASILFLDATKLIESSWKPELKSLALKLSIPAACLAMVINCSSSGVSGNSQQVEPPSPPNGKTFEVMTVEDYHNPVINLTGLIHPEGDSLVGSLKQKGWSLNGWYKDDAVVPSLFEGSRTFPDLMIYDGHGTGNGPSLNNGEFLKLDKFRWADQPNPLRWFFNGSCKGLFDDPLAAGDAPNWVPRNGGYFLGSWLQAVGYGQNGMHAYMAHRALSYATPYPNMLRGGVTHAVTQSLGGKSVGEAWFEAASVDVLELGVPGEEPAVLSAYDPEKDLDYFNESLSAPWPDPSPKLRIAENGAFSEHRNLSFHSFVYGAPAGYRPSAAIAHRDSLVYEFEGELSAESGKERLINAFGIMQKMQITEQDGAVSFEVPRSEKLVATHQLDAAACEEVARRFVASLGVSETVELEGVFEHKAKKGDDPQIVVDRTYVFRMNQGGLPVIGPGSGLHVIIAGDGSVRGGRLSLASLSKINVVRGDAFGVKTPNCYKTTIENGLVRIVPAVRTVEQVSNGRNMVRIEPFL